MRVQNPQVINGQQTTRTLQAALEGSTVAAALVRIICVPRTTPQEADRFEKLVTRIVKATNWQNPIGPADLMSNDQRQVDLDRNLAKLDYQYIRKRQSKGEARRNAGIRHRFIVKMEDMAKAVAACELDPVKPRKGKQHLFEEELYDQVFPNSDPAFFLPRYWVTLHAASAARGYPERAYSKWLAVHFVWSVIQKLIGRDSSRQLFVKASERGQCDAIARVFDVVYKQIQRFYRANRGSGDTAIDVSSFFQRTELHHKFRQHWKDLPASEHAKLEKSLAAVQKQLLHFEQTR